MRFQRVRVYEGRMVWQHAAAMLVGAEAEISHLELHVCIDVPMCVWCIYHTWNYGWLRTTLWMLGIIPESSTRGTSALNYWTYSLSQTFLFFNISPSLYPPLHFSFPHFLFTPLSKLPSPFNHPFLSFSSPQFLPFPSFSFFYQLPIFFFISVVVVQHVYSFIRIAIKNSSSIIKLTWHKCFWLWMFWEHLDICGLSFYADFFFQQLCFFFVSIFYC